MTTNSTSTDEASAVDYRIAIADECGCPGFRDVVLNSNSNIDAAIYFRKKHLRAIADRLGVKCFESKTNGELRSSIRKHLQIPPYDAVLPATTSTPSTEGPPSPTPIRTDGGVTANTTSRIGTGEFKFNELVEIANAIGTVPDFPYIEPELRRLAGSSIAGPYLAHLVNEAYVDLYLSVNVGSTTAPKGSRAYYPYRLEQAHEIPESATSHPECYRYIVDSSYNKPEYGNEEVLDTAHRVDADTVVLADVLNDIDGTVEAVIEGLELYEEHDFDGDIIIPLQPPHDECFVKLRNRGVSMDHTFALGGLKNCNDDKKKINAAKSLREVAGDEVSIHGLGYGITPQIADAIRENPNLLDSMDYSTPAQSGIDNLMKGKEGLCTVAARAGAGLVEDLRRISPLVDTARSTTLGDF